MREENRSEIIHDALNLLDDEMIEEVARLRGGVISDVTPVVLEENETQENDVYKELRPWRKWAALAASVSIVILAGSFLNGNLGESAIFQSGDSNHMNEEGILDMESDMENDMEFKDNLSDAIPESDNLTGEHAEDEVYDEDTEIESTEVEGTEIEE